MRWAAMVGFGAALALSGAAMAQPAAGPYQAGERVELNANGDHWQQCVVTEPGSRESVMRLQCEPYSAPGYSRGGGVYVASYNSSDVRRAGNGQGGGSAPAGASTPVSGGGYTVGQAVEVEASGHWVPCTVSEITTFGASPPMIRVRCAGYPALSRAAGTYIVHNNETGIRPATGQTGRATPPPTAAPRAPTPRPAAAGATLRTGEYGCVGFGGQMMIGLGFKVTGPGTYTDLDGGRAGTFSVNGGIVRFRGGHLDGVTGRDLNAQGGFIVAQKGECEPW